MNFRSTLIAGAVAALMMGPTWAASDSAKKDGAQPATQAERAADRNMGTGAPTPGQAATGQATPGTAGSTATPSATPGSTMGSPAATTASSAIYSRTADDLEKMDVVNAEGEKIGDIKKVVLSQDRKRAHAVISAGGFLGIGSRDVLVSLDELRPVGDDKLQMNATKDELKARGEYNADQYVELQDNDRPLSGIVEFSAFEPAGGAARPGATPTPGAMPAPGGTPGATPSTPRATPDTPQSPASPAR